jgi:hypothetical protein
MYARSQDLDDDGLARFQLSGMNLRDRSRRERFAVELRVDVVYAAAERTLDSGDSQLARKRRYAVLEFGEFVSDIGREQISTGRDGLAELHEDRSEILQTSAHAHAEVVASRTAWDQPPQPAYRPEQVRRPNELLETVLDQRALNSE